MTPAMVQLSKRLLRPAIAVLVLAIIGYWALRPRPVPADFAAVARGDLQVTVEEEGRTRVRDRYVISAPMPGRMRRIELDAGDPVVAGNTVLAQFLPADPVLLDDRVRAELEARVRAAESALSGARADRERLDAELAFAQAELKRSRELVDQRVIAQRELEAAQRQEQSLERARQSASFAVSTAQHQLEVARAGLLQSRSGRATPIALHSPVSGVVLRRLQESETVVSTGQPLIEVGNLDDLEIVADLLSSAAVNVAPGQAVFIDQWGGSRALRGRVRRVEPSGFTKISPLGVEEQRVNAVIDFDEPRSAWGTIGDGYRVEVRIVVWARDDVVKVPASSLVRYETGWAVYKVENGVAKRRTVEVGRQNGLEAEITNGLSAGDQIVVYPSDAVHDGAKLTRR